ncbi:MAG: transcriptional repressor [Spirochaetes bacterium]|nr:transcriptional repressor [Spirochaetota bacterium]MBX3720613.1 transcriptional repressor [Turneriella sp.]
MQKPADIAEFLKARGLRVSLQKLEIAKHVLGEHRHFTAEEIFKEINTDFPRVSRATVFNVLNLFVEHGLLKTVQARSDVLLYDSNTEDHDHVVVAATGKIFDVQLPEKEKQAFLKTLWIKNPHLPKKAAAQVVVHV